MTAHFARRAPLFGGRSPGRSTDRAEAQTAAVGGSSMGQGRESRSGAPRTASALEIPGDGTLERRILRPYPKDSDEAGGDQGLHFPGPHG